MWDFAGIVKVIIDRPAGQVWPHFFGDRKEIWSKAKYIPISGEPGKVGEIYAMAESFRQGRFLFEAIKVESEQHLVLKITYQDDATSEQVLSGFDFISLTEISGQTTVTLQQAFSAPVQLSEADRVAETEKHAAMLRSIFRGLKGLVESEPISA